MNILVRLPNWLGDIVMSTGFLNTLAVLYPGSTIDVIVKDSFKELIPLLPGITDTILFSRRQHSGFGGSVRFGRECAARKKYDLYISLPNSFSSAVTGFFSRSTRRIGYSAELRSFLLTDACKKPSGMHRAEEYVNLLRMLHPDKTLPCTILLKEPTVKDESALQLSRITNHPRILVNIHSAAQSRKLPHSKAVSLCKMLIERLHCTLLFTGTQSESEYTSRVISSINDPQHCIDYSGKLNLVQLAHLCTLADIALSTDSGIAHLANAVGTHVVVLFGAGNEKSTAPYNSKNCTIVRADGISCAPCVSNTCRFGHVQCMHSINENRVIETISSRLKIFKMNTPTESTKSGKIS
ncbi:MAG TPA: lipopolysaccharide heptosyltransferase II [Chitinispirillaceae bacterium]|nr:lipopolysaccharide heptosyltransferase II [Chitinispirillaceae bacterium]